MKLKGFVIKPSDDREKIKQNLLKILSEQGIEVVEDKKLSEE